MTVFGTLPAPVIQMGHVEKIVEVAQNQPQVQQQVAQEAALQTARERQQRIAGIETTKQGRRVREREAGEKKRQKAGPDRRKAPPGQAPPGQAPEDEAAAPAGEARTTNLWAGRILDLKI
jgi:hypothetical protein